MTLKDDIGYGTTAPVPPKLQRCASTASLCLLLVGAVVSTLYSLGTLPLRFVDGVEGEVLFEAERIRRHLPLYVSPALGAWEYGAPPARYLVLYTPLWPLLLSAVPQEARLLVARSLDALGWSLLLVWMIRRTAPALRRQTLVAVAFVVSMPVLSFFTSSARPDMPALLLAGVAIERTVRQRRVDLLAGLLFGLAAWTKPNVLGAAPGLFVACAWVAWRDGGWRRMAAVVLPGAAGVLCVVGLCVVGLSLWAGPVWLEHLTASTLQGASWDLLAHHLARRSQFLLLPFVWLFWSAIHYRRSPHTAIALGGLTSSVAWMLLSLAKIGGYWNYLLEPSLVAIALVSHTPLLWPRRPRLAALAAGVVLLQMLWVEVANLRHCFEETWRVVANHRFMRDVRASCGAPAGRVLMADEPGIELMANDRIVSTAFQSTQLARHGRFDVQLWLDDLARPEVDCFVVISGDVVERPLEKARPDRDLIPAAVILHLREHFRLDEQRGSFRLYRRKVTAL